jgi:maltooligosyltrehalose trehalohydrolase
LIALRKQTPAFRDLGRDAGGVVLSSCAIVMRRGSPPDEAIVALHFGERPSEVAVSAAAGRWQRALDSSDERWLGPGSSLPEDFDSSGTIRLPMAAHSICILQRRV